MTQFTRRHALGLLAAVPLLPALGGPAAAAVEDAVMGDLPLGQEKAPVTVIEYASLTCPHCAHFHTTTYAKFKEKYVDTGKVRFIFRDFPFDRLAVMGGVLARCAGPQRYYGMLSVLFQQQRQWAQAPDPVAALTQIGRMAGLSKERVDACFQDQALADAVLNNRLEGEKKFQVSSTPSFVIDGRTHSGALTLEQLDKLLGPLTD